jgi:hypothetical protein
MALSLSTSSPLPREALVWEYLAKISASRAVKKSKDERWRPLFK